jgi:polysaccharide pyruvyl transferase WcaK-like protein
MNENMKNDKLHLMFNGLGSGNIGDEAMFLAFVNHYPLPPGTTIEVYDPSSAIIKTLPGQFQYTDWKDDDRNNQLANDSSAVLLVGNTPVMYKWGLGYPLQALANRLLYCHSIGTPVHAVGVGVDYLDDKDAREIFCSAFLPIASWTVRSPHCRSALLDLGVTSDKIIVGSDLAWLFSPDVTDRQWAREFWQSIGIDISKPVLGVNVVNERWAEKNEVKSSIAKALDNIIAETGIQVAFLCNETRDGDYFDAHCARTIIGMMKQETVFVPNIYFTPSQIVTLLSFCKITLSQRYHFTLFSVLANTVPVSFARGEKIAALLEELEEKPAGTMDLCNANYLQKRIREVLADRSAIMPRQQSAAVRLKKRAKNDFQFIDERISGSIHC